jgi:hypothetical protein
MKSSAATVSARPGMTVPLTLLAIADQVIE